MVLRRGSRDPRIERALGDLEQPLRELVDLADGHGDRRVGVHALKLNAEIELHDVSVVKHALPRRDAVHDFFVDRDAGAARKPVESLEGRFGPRMRADERLTERVEFAGADTWANMGLHVLQRGVQQSAAACHDVDLAR